MDEMFRVIKGSKEKNKPYTMFYNDILAIKGLSSKAKLCYLTLTMFAGADGECYPSYQTIADKMSVSRMTAIRAIKELESVNLLDKSTRKHKTNSKIPVSNFYILYDAENYNVKPNKNLPSAVLKLVYDE